MIKFFKNLFNQPEVISSEPTVVIKKERDIDSEIKLAEQYLSERIENLLKEDNGDKYRVIVKTDIGDFFSSAFQSTIEYRDIGYSYYGRHYYNEKERQLAYLSLQSVYLKNAKEHAEGYLIACMSSGYFRDFENNIVPLQNARLIKLIKDENEST